MLRSLFPTIFFFVFLHFSAFSSTGVDTPRDTVTAVVVYNAETTFVPRATFGVADYSHMIDSLVRLDTVPVSLVNQLNIYRILAAKSPKTLNLVIDSIFDSDFVPQPVLNAVNTYMTVMGRALAQPTGFAAYVPVSDSPYPSATFYNNWNTEIAYPVRNNLAAFDSTLKLLLVDSTENCGYSPPIHGVITSLFGYRNTFGRNHNGIDIDLEVWDPVHVAFPGVVRVAKYVNGFGRVVIVRHYNGLETTYAHLHRFKVQPGDEVEAGDVIGLGGSSGHSTGSHLHFEIRFQGVPIDPSQIIDFETFSLKGSTVSLKKKGVILAVVPDTESNPEKVYEVKHGDYLYKIAQQFGTTVQHICKLNGIQSKSNLYEGQQLIIGS